MRIHLKGGVWKNTEDEILKAAVMKYGKTQWARISSLLVRKTPKQCKARWYEWLDPSIKKTEWSKEEDEKLLHLAKLMPTQWRTIAPIVGRAPAQCLERYQRLLDEAEARATGEDDGLGLQGAAGTEGQAEARRLRPGEIDPNPESKAARPDPVDMDEDEKDMLSEARARLANTQGKKAKRKARERQLEEARRLATLQKRRELKAAGVDLKIKKKKKDKLHLDYNAEIPYEKRPMPGFYDTTTELTQADKGAESLRGRFLDSLESKSRVEREADERKEAKRKRDNKGVAFVRASDQKTIEAFAENEEVDQLAKRSRLVLPAPQVNDGELETIAKLGQQSVMARDLVAGGSTDTLLGDYADTSSVAARTPRTPAQSNRVMNEALAQRALAAQPTPLLGGESSSQAVLRGEGTGYDGVLPRGADAATPNPLALSLRPNASSSGAAASTARDELGLNTPLHSVGTTAREQKMAGRSLREQLALKLAKLPAPKNELEIVVPEIVPESEALEIASAAQAVEDQADVERRMEKMRIEEAELEMRRRTKCVQLDLPRPNAIPTSTLAVAADPSIPEAVLGLIGSEMRALMLCDARKYPVPDMPLLRPAHPSDAQLDDIADSLLEAAKSLVDEEMSNMPEDVREVYQQLGERTGHSIWHTAEDTETWLPQAKRFVDTDKVSNAEWIEKHRLDLASRRELMAEEAARATKIEKKLGVTLGGYQARSKTLDGKIAEAFKAFEQAKLDSEAFGALYAAEQAIIPARIEKAQAELRKVETRESQLQAEYRELIERRNALSVAAASSSSPSRS
ncbi:Pre-mRNA-splicing factor cef1 [Coemansia sp. S16]|nr:Pre-mRNA-splicing factor cef1 [Coemansia sp. S680]KAJ2048795.1 Pre-mRNA-splicing factor cef1 [Coemansia sp. S16]KAJ2069606.1 Pre-mRNA-splicing factor cef1 [Coemansia sp. S2]KAJ2071832.1 Pre-mRNA-splicing factor cef1 [Coemansia sp. S155-1]KAJ2354182.1 Pre-mRNA-splicing factor cef1 [Coemansia sp. RSA 2673]